jgi:N-acetylglucosamine-6-sulfatase
MLRIAWLALVLAITACGGDGPPLPTTTDLEPTGDVRPNMIVVVVDDLRWDELGVAGHPYVKTPHIDSIAAAGAYFTNAFTTTPLCSPARASLLTGQYAHVHGITDNLARNEQSHRLETFPRRLHEVGYDTAFIGKWHMGNDDSPRPGFRRWVGMKGQGEALDPELNVDGERHQFDGYVTDILTAEALKFIQEPRDAPFLLYVSHKALHPNITQLDDGSTAASPSGVPGFIAADRHRGMYADAAVPRRANSGIAPVDKPALMRQIGELPPLSADTITDENTIHERQEMLMAVDDGLGKLLAAVNEMGLSEDTIVVVTSDHGYWYGEHGLSAERRLAYEEAARIPLIIKYPKRIDAGRAPDQIALSIDLASTMIDYAGETPGKQRNGRSLVPILDGAAPEWRNAFLIEYYSDTVFERINMMGYKAVRTDRYKYIQYQDLDGMDELYDLQQDPYELSNIIDDESSADVLAVMRSELERLLAQSD